MRLRPGTPGYRPRSRRHSGRRRRPRPRISRSWSSGRASGLRCRGLGNLRGRREESRHPQPPQNHRASSWQQICKRETRYFQVDFLTKKICALECSSVRTTPLVFISAIFKCSLLRCFCIFTEKAWLNITVVRTQFCINCSTIMS